MTRIVPSLARFFTLAAFLFGPAVPQGWGSPQGPTKGGLSSLGEAGWSTLAANPQRTSWTPEEVRGWLRPVWYRVLDPYISGKVQIIAENDLLYVSTARGLYALHTGDNPSYPAGGLAWVYPTALPLGHSPTVTEGVVYVGGYDRRIHALAADPDLSTLPVDRDTGYRINDQILWTFEAGETSGEMGAGFETNPLVVGTSVFAGNRNGVFYALDAKTGALKWKYETEGPILFSAAYQDDTVFFASNDSHAYALNATTGRLVWRSKKLPGAGFHSFWPVIYKGWVIYAGSENYRMAYFNDGFPSAGTQGNLTGMEGDELYPNHEDDPLTTTIGLQGTEPGDWVEGTVTIDTSQPTNTANGSTKPITEYLEEKPWRRTYFVLNRFTGEELTFDLDGDGKPEYAPFPWAGTHSGNRYPPVIGGDGVLYQYVNYLSDPWIMEGGIAGWKFATPIISRISQDRVAVDEPQAYSAGGNLIYWNHFDSLAGAYDISVPMGGPNRDWAYWDWDGLDELVPGYEARYFKNHPEALAKVFGSPNGIYEQPSTTLVPYRGRVYFHRRNSIIALGESSTSATQLPRLTAVPTPDPSPQVTAEQLERDLSEEVQKMLSAGHLRPGYHSTGIWDAHAVSSNYPGQGIGDYLIDYFHNPADTLYTLLRALPHLPSDLQRQTKDYLQREFTDYPPYAIAHIGWAEGTPREAFDTPPEVQSTMDRFPSRSHSGTRWDSPAEWWLFPQDSFYALWKYAQEFGGAREIFDQIRDKIESPPGNEYLSEYPHIHNAYIAGYIGYLELQKLAGERESPDVRAELDRLLTLRAANFTKDSPAFPVSGAYATNYKNTLNLARNFMYMVPELADYLNRNAYDRVLEAVEEYSEIAPGWFVSKYDATYGEGFLDQLYGYHALFQAKALILQEPREALVRYLDVPAFARGDLFYIQNLVAALEAPTSGPDPTQTFADVPFDHPYHDEIEVLYQAGYTAGCGTDPLRYCPDQAMSRAESAVFVQRGAHGVDVQPAQPASQTFADLPLESWAAKWAEALYVDGFTVGCGVDPLRFCPWQGHTRAEGAVFYLRMLHGVDYQPPAAQGIFSDVALGVWYAKWAEAAFGAGLIPVCSQPGEPLRFCPDDPLSRGLAAYMMVRAKNLPGAEQP